ncbi:universal stress protein [Granulosicoccaceae sp. 1_MG-2023]|nr:universal stress protein [Granulosicoccaceae sp. 1_MG-2023]
MMNKQYDNILVPVDLAHASSWRKALPEAVAFALRHQSQLHLMTVVPDADIPAIAVHLPDNIDQKIRRKGQEALEQLSQREIPQDLSSRTVVAQGRVDKQILRVAAEVGADLIVMASHRPKTSDYLFSANAAYVTRHAACSVMVVREKQEEH